MCHAGKPTPTTHPLTHSTPFLPKWYTPPSTESTKSAQSAFTRSQINTREHIHTYAHTFVNVTVAVAGRTAAAVAVGEVRTTTTSATTIPD